MTKQKKPILEEFELELNPLFQAFGLVQTFEGIPASEEERAKQKDGIISEIKKGNETYQIIKKKGKYYGKIILK